MPDLIRLYIKHCLIGFAIAAGFVAMLLYFDIANMWHLVSHSDKGWLAVLVLWLANGVVFAGVQFGIAVMNMKDDDDDEPRGGKRQHVQRPTGQMIPVRVAAGGPDTRQQRR
ncbi:hypothetical protein DC366_03260 [Pelagivirga sediminicola]|uniref:Uncharacterized protein n=1 Tax=Pelagivirga sediminicola TaxID=2170575 RepID=A0A2T7GC08_9RHOB|nr:hypothetical protein [Pelagivirga sediminicola]PVA11951.1 hypothetical protein DC366_03260 [Pelagivirga sediminicola]